MPEPAVKKGTATEDIILALFALILIANAMQTVPRLLQEKLGINIASPYLVAGVALTEDTPPGTEVVAVDGTPYFEDAGDSTPAGEFPPGALLTVKEGPDRALGGARWWLVQSEEPPAVGWVPEAALVRARATAFADTARIGSKAQVVLESTMRSVPGGLARTTEAAKGALGTIVDGPDEANGSRWWYLSLDDVREGGWLPESVLVAASESGFQAGSRVRATRAADLYSDAGGGVPQGVLRKGVDMRVIGGPKEVGGTVWWLVETGDGTQGWVPEDVLEEGGAKGWARGVIGLLLTVAVIFTVVLLGGIVYATIRTNQIRAREAARIREAMQKPVPAKRNERWDTVVEHVKSDNPNDWRVAILEADIMLDELVTKMGLMGNTLGERLKQAARGDFRTLDAAWEAHRIRNEIAHAGSDYVLTKREAERVIGLYEEVFREFRFAG